MTRVAKNRECVTNVSLMILGKLLDPKAVSRALRMKPNQYWRKGERKQVGDSLHQWGGWKKWPPASVRSKPLVQQLRYWAKELESLSDAIGEISSAKNQCILDCFVSTDGTMSIVLDSELQRRVSALGVELHLSIWDSGNAG